MSYQTLQFHVDDDGIATLTLDRPEALNAFSVTMGAELLDFFTSRATQDDIRAVVVTGAGRAFCAGMDLTREGNAFGLDESLSPTEAKLRAHLADPAVHPKYETGVRDSGGRIALAIHALPKPVIAAINGPAVGVGATLPCAMDARLASTSARIGFVFGRLGIVPEATSSYFLPRIVGLPRALEWVWSAEILTAQQAFEGGLVRSLHEPGDLLPAANALARSWTVGRSATAIGYAKKLLTADFATALDAHVADSLAMWHTSRGAGKEGVAAFVGKRAPHFEA